MIPNAPHAVSESIRVGNGAGFWGDNLDAPYLLARDGRIDVLTLEYLAELTMAILSHLRSKDPKAGFVTDFPDLVERLTPILVENEGLRIVTNAGGLNPPACAARCGDILKSAGLVNLAIGVVTGDDVLGLIPEWIGMGIDLSHLETGALDHGRGLAAGGGQRLPGSQADRGGTAIGAQICGHRPGRRCLTDFGPGGRSLRLAVGRMEQARRCFGCRPLDRMRRPGDGRAVARLDRAI